MRLFAFGSPPMLFLPTIVLTTAVMIPANIDNESKEKSFDELFAPVAMMKHRAGSLAPVSIQNGRQKWSFVVNR